MASTKSLTVSVNNVTMTAGAGSVTSTTTNLLTGYGAVAYLKLTNGATGPTIAGQIQISVSTDDSNYYNFGGPLVGGVTNSGVSSWAIELPIGIKYVQYITGSNTGQNVTARVETMEISAV